MAAFSRRDFLTGVLATGTLSAMATYLAPGGRSPSKVNLIYATGVDPTGVKQLLVDAWNADNRSTHVDLRPLGGGAVDQRVAMIDLADKGDADILDLDIVDIPYFRERGYLVPQELENVSQFIPSTLFASSTADPAVSPSAGTAPKTDPAKLQHWAAPFNADAGMLFKRVGTGSPSTSGDGPSLPEVIDRYSRPGTYQFAGQLQPSSTASQEAFVVNVLEHALSRDKDILDPVTGIPVRQIERWQKALQPLRDAVRGGRITLCGSEDDTRSKFSDQRLFYMRNWPVKYRELVQNSDPDIGASRIKVVPLLPFGILGGQSLALVAKSDNHARATEFIHFMTSDPAQKVLLSYGLASPRLGPYSATQLQTFIPHLESIRGAVEQARLRPISPRYAEFATVVSRYADAMLRDDQDLSSAFVDDFGKALDGN